MKTIKILEEDELKDKLLDTECIISDEICNLISDYHEFVKNNPRPEDDEDESPEANKWWNENIELQTKYEKIICKKIYKYLVEDEE